MGYRKLGRRTNHRRSLLRNLVTDALWHQHVVTTVTRAKEVQRQLEHMITLAKRGDLHARRQAGAYLQAEDVATRLFQDIAPRYAQRSGGYTRLTRIGARRGDGAPLCRLELV